MKSETVYECARCSGKTQDDHRCKKHTCKIPKLCWQHLAKEKNLKVKKSTIPNAGQGLFALKTFPKDTSLGEYKGKVMSREEFDKKYGDDGGQYGADLGPNKVVDAASTQSTVLRYVNGSDNPKKKLPSNTKFKVKGKNKAVEMRTTKKVEKGQEFLVPYGKGYWGQNEPKKT